MPRDAHFFKLSPQFHQLVGLYHDTQKIARLAADPRIEGEGSQLAGKLSILGALTLYLDFLNLFLFLLNIFGRIEN